MDRGLRAQLSPNEEATLRQLSLSGLDEKRLRPSNVEHLVALRLIDRRDGAWRLTDIGILRLKGFNADRRSKG